jgi:hypothetical protein
MCLIINREKNLFNKDLSYLHTFYKLVRAKKVRQEQPPFLLSQLKWELYSPIVKKHKIVIGQNVIEPYIKYRYSSPMMVDYHNSETITAHDYFLSYDKVEEEYTVTHGALHLYTTSNICCDKLLSYTLVSVQVYEHDILAYSFDEKEVAVLSFYLSQSSYNTAIKSVKQHINTGF